MHGSSADSQCLSLFLSRRIFILVCGVAPAPWSCCWSSHWLQWGLSFPDCSFFCALCLLSMCSALISCSALLFSCSSSILVSLKDDKGTEIALHEVFRGVILWFPGESKLASCLLVNFLGFFGFLFLLLSFETCMLKAQPHRKPSLTKPQEQNYHTPPLPKTISKIT